ncbi:MAG: hypothetical protein ACPKM0_10305 [Pleomorphochaeta sp.]
MNRKILGLLIALCLIVPVSLSAEALDLSIGGTAQYQFSADDTVSGSEEDFFDIENYKFGAEARVKLLLVEASDIALVGTTDDGGVQISNLMTAGVSFDLLNLVRVGVGLGPKFEVNFNDDGTVTDAWGDEFVFTDIFMKSNCTYKANVDFLLGGLTLSANYTVDSQGFNINNIVNDEFTMEDLAPADWGQGQFGIAVLISLI